MGHNSTSGDLEYVLCTVVSEGVLNCTNELWVVEESQLGVSDALFWIYMGVCVFLVLFAGLMSGLTLGLLSLDLTTLAIIQRGNDEKKKKYAADIIPIVSRHHQLLVTLLLANAGAMEALPIFLDKISDPITAILVSVTAVLFFGEIIPQAICSRFGLAIGSKLKYLVWTLIVIAWPLNYPLGLLLDYLIGVDHGTYYHRDELRQLVDLHAKEHIPGEEGLNVDEVTIIKGALDLTTMTVGDRMIGLEKIFMIEETARLDVTTLSELEIHGHSRVPVYRGNRGNIVGILMIKSLISRSYKEDKLVHDLLLGRVVRVPTDMLLYDLLNIFQTGAGHMAIVYPPVDNSNVPGWLTLPPGSQAVSLTVNEDEVMPDALGMITLEDVIETLLKEEIRDETDYARMQALLSKPRARTILSAATGARAVPISSFITPTDNLGTRTGGNRAAPDDMAQSAARRLQDDGYPYMPPPSRRTKSFVETLLGPSASAAGGATGARAGDANVPLMSPRLGGNAYKGDGLDV